jgi:hypothetical protein
MMRPGCRTLGRRWTRLHRARCPCWGRGGGIWRAEAGRVREGEGCMMIMRTTMMITEGIGTEMWGTSGEGEVDPPGDRMDRSCHKFHPRYIRRPSPGMWMHWTCLTPSQDLSCPKSSCAMNSLIKTRSGSPSVVKTHCTYQGRLPSTPRYTTLSQLSSQVVHASSSSASPAPVRLRGVECPPGEVFSIETKKLRSWSSLGDEGKSGRRS